MDNLAVWYSRLDANVDRGATPCRARPQAGQGDGEQTVAKAQTKDSLKALAKLTHVVDGEVRIDLGPAADRPDRGARAARRTITRSSMRSTQLVPRVPALAAARPSQARRGIPRRRTSRARSSGSAASGRELDHAAARSRRQRPLFLQIKEAEAVRARAVPRQARVSQPRPAGRRGPADDAGGERHLPRLDSQPEGPRRQRSATSTSASCGTGRRRSNLDTILPRGLELYADMCGWTLARAHARSGDRVAIASYLGKSDVFDRAVADFAVAYADLNERDYAAMQAAVVVRPPHGRGGRLRTTFTVFTGIAQLCPLPSRHGRSSGQADHPTGLAARPRRPRSRRPRLEDGLRPLGG